MRACSRLRKNNRNGGSWAAQSGPYPRDEKAEHLVCAMPVCLGSNRVVIPIDIEAAQLPLMLHCFDSIWHQQIVIPKGLIKETQFQEEICIGEENIVLQESDVIKGLTSSFSRNTGLEQNPLCFKTEQTRSRSDRKPPSNKDPSQSLR